VISDNLYTSVALTYALRERKTFYVGTVRKQAAFFPKPLLAKKSKDVSSFHTALSLRITENAGNRLLYISG